MKYRFYFFFVFFSFLLLFYPGDSFYYHIFAYNRAVFAQKEESSGINIPPVPYVRTSTPPAISAEGVLILDLPTFTPLYEKNIHTRFFPASTTKVITALVAVDIYKPDDVIQIKKIMPEGQVMGLVQNERITVENLLHGLLIHSGNDAAYAFADNYGFDAFIDLMNKKAKTLGMKDSHFTNPAGLDNPLQYSTPTDLALASRELLRHPFLGKIVSIKDITVSDIDFTIFHHLSNVNKLLGEIQGIGGLKTGYTEQAGENLVSFYKKGGHQFLIVILKSLDRFEDTKAVVNWIGEEVDYATLE
ncbi:MAG: D-alanyl-D-alanine carboxypeptidase family protein [bacterium]|nr:D-alanyl-D-alanine carboxypeptidase family protein [bacterium]